MNTQTDQERTTIDALLAIVRELRMMRIVLERMIRELERK